MKECALFLGVLFLFLTSNGQQELLDTSYGVDGRSIVDFLDRDETRSTALDASDRLLIAGTHLFTSNSDLYVCRLTTEGEIDETFAEDGPTPGFFHYVPDSSLGRWTAPIIKVLDSGKILVGMAFGIISNGSQTELVPHILRLNSNGELDAAFGENGLLVLSGHAVISEIIEGSNGDVFVLNVVNPVGNSPKTRLIRISGNGQEVDEDFAEDAIDYLSGPYFSFSPDRIIFSQGELLVLNTAVLPNPDSPSNSWPHQKYLVVWKISADSGQLVWDYGVDGSFEYHIVDDTDITDVISYVVADAVLNYEANLFVTLLPYSGASTPSKLVKIDSTGQLRNDFAEDGVLIFDYPGSSCNKFSFFAKHPTYGYFIMSYNSGALDDCGSGTISICQISDDGAPLYMEGTSEGTIEIEESFTVHLPRLQVQSDGKLLLTSFYFPYQDNNDTDIKTIRIHTDQVSLVPELYPESTASVATYPNPATDQLRIKLDLPQEAGGHNTFELVMHDLQGRVVYRQNHPGLHLAEGSINVSNFAPGVYTLHCVIDGVWVDSEKVVIGR